MKSDLELQREVLAELHWDPSLDAAHIDLVVDHGVVTLAGQVRSLSGRRCAELAARRVVGVMALDDRIDVVPDDIDHPTDGDITLGCERALRWACSLPNMGVQVMVKQGWLTLTGTVHGDFQRRAAVTAVRHIPGVAGITDRIVLARAVPVDVATANTENATRRSLPAVAPKPDPPEPGDDLNVSSWPCGSKPRSRVALLLHRRPFRER